MDKEEIKKKRKEISELKVGGLELQELSKTDLILDILEDMQESQELVLESQEPQSEDPLSNMGIDTITHFYCDSCGEPHQKKYRERSMEGNFCFGCVIDRLRKHIESDTTLAEGEKVDDELFNGDNLTKLFKDMCEYAPVGNNYGKRFALIIEQLRNQFPPEEEKDGFESDGMTYHDGDTNGPEEESGTDTDVGVPGNINYGRVKEESGKEKEAYICDECEGCGAICMEPAIRDNDCCSVGDCEDCLQSDICSKCNGTGEIVNNGRENPFFRWWDESPKRLNILKLIYG